MRRLWLISLILLLLGILSSCSSQQDISNEPISPDDLEFHIGRWEKSVLEANLGYTVKSSWPLLKEWYLTDAPFIINLNDIESYEWEKHEMWLTANASAKFQTFDESPAIAGMAFVVTVNKQPIYGGVFTFYPSAEAIRFPVIYTDKIGKKIRFTPYFCANRRHFYFLVQIGAISNRSKPPEQYLFKHVTSSSENWF